MGQLIGDHKIAFGNGKNGKVLFVDIGEYKGRRGIVLLSAQRVGEADAYSGHVILSDASGVNSPDAYPVSFSVERDANDAAIAHALTAVTHLQGRLLMASWDGESLPEISSVQNITEAIKNFSGSAKAMKSLDGQVVRTSVLKKHFTTQRENKEEKVQIFAPKVLELRIMIGEQENALAAAEAAKKAAGPALKVGEKALLAPRIDVDLAKAALSSIPSPSVMAFDYFGGAAIPHEGEDTRLNDRAQAAKSYPILAEMIASNHLMKSAVDERQALLPLILETTGLSKGALKRLSKIKTHTEHKKVEGGNVIIMADQLGANRQIVNIVRGSLSLRQAIDHLKNLPPDWVPDNDEAWNAFTDILAGLAIPLSNVIDKPVKDILGSAKGDWVSFRAALAKAADVPVKEFTRDRMSTLTGEIINMLDTLNRTAIIPMLGAVLVRTNNLAHLKRTPELIDSAYDIGSIAAPKIVIGKAKNPLAALLEAERRFISRDAVIYGLTRKDVIVNAGYEGAPNNFGDMVGNRAFPVLRETWVASNGYEVVPLRNEAEMMAEGRLMAHCVGTNYAHTGSNGEYHFFSVRHPDNANAPTERATLRLNPVSVGSQITVGEYRSYDNRNVNGACEIAFREWKASFLPKDIDEAGARMDEWRRWRREHGIKSTYAGLHAETPAEFWKRKVGSKADVGLSNELWEEWANNVLSGWSPDSSEVLFREPMVRDALLALSPSAAEELKKEADARRAEAQRQDAPAL